MDRRLRRAPDAEWVLMYRLGLSRQRIAALVRAEPATVGYHLAIARRQDPGLEAEHQATAGAAPIPYPSPKDLARMEQVIAWVSAEGRQPVGRSADRGERSMARWMSARRREAAKGALAPAYSAGLALVPGWSGDRRDLRTNPAGTTAWPCSRSTTRRATTGPATGRPTQSGNTPSGSGSTPSGTKTAAANSTPRNSSS